MPRWLPEYYATATTALLPHQLVYTSLNVLAPPPPPQSEPRLPPQPTRCCSHPNPGSYSHPSHATASITKPVQNHPPITALNPLHPVAPAFVCWYSLTTAYGARTVLTGRHPKTSLFAVKNIFGYWPRRTYPTTTHVGIVTRSVCGNLPVRSISLKFRPPPAATTVVQTATEPPNPTLLPHCPTRPKPQPPTTPHAPPPYHLLLGSRPPFFSDYHLHHHSSPPTTYITDIHRSNSDSKVAQRRRRHPIRSGRDGGRDHPNCDAHDACVSLTNRKRWWIATTIYCDTGHNLRRASLSTTWPSRTTRLAFGRSS